MLYLANCKASEGFTHQEIEPKVKKRTFEIRDFLYALAQIEFENYVTGTSKPNISE